MMCIVLCLWNKHTFRNQKRFTELNYYVGNFELNVSWELSHRSYSYCLLMLIWKPVTFHQRPSLNYVLGILSFAFC